MARRPLELQSLKWPFVGLAVLLALSAVWQWKKDTPFLRQLGMLRYGLVATLFMIMSGVLVKMALRLTFNIKYILVIPNILNI